MLKKVVAWIALIAILAGSLPVDGVYASERADISASEIVESEEEVVPEVYECADDASVNDVADISGSDKADVSDNYEAEIVEGDEDADVSDNEFADDYPSGYWDKYKNEVGAYPLLLTDTTLLSFEPEVSLIGKKISFYASKNKDLSNPVLLGTRKITDIATKYPKTGDEPEFLKGIAVDLEEVSLEPGSWNVFVTVAGNMKKISTNELSLYVLPAPRREDITTVSESPLTISVKKREGAEAAKYVYICKWGETSAKSNTWYEFKDKDSLEISSHQDKNLSASERYYVCYRTNNVTLNGTELMQREGTVYLNSEYTEVIFDEPVVEGDKIELYDIKTAIAITTDYTVFMGEQATLLTRVRAEATKKAASDQRVIFESSNTKVFTVDAVGNITPKAPGVAKLTVKSVGYKGLEAVVNITVKETLKYGKFAFDNDTTKLKLKKSDDNISVGITIDEGLTGSVRWNCEPRDAVIFSSYYTNISNGKAETKISYINYPGPVTITAMARADGSPEKHYETKTISLNLCVDGATEKAAYKGGKQLTGWVTVGSNGDILKTGKDASNIYKDPKYDPNQVFVLYYSPETKNAVSGLNMIDRKYYYFGGGSDLGQYSLVRGTSRFDTETLSSKHLAVNKEGEVLTGWVNANGYYYYFDPILKRDCWIYEKSKKGAYFVDSETGAALLTTGLVTLTPWISDNYYDNTYYLKDGVQKTGWIYLDQNGNSVSKAKAVDWVYADPSTGIVKQSEMFEIGKKTYYADSDGYVVRESRFWVKDDYYWAEKDGTVAKNKFVIIAGNKYYADSYGVLTIYTMLKFINGKMYRLENGKIGIVEPQLSKNYALGEGIPVYIKSASKKPEDGIFFYSDPECSKKVVNVWLYTGSGSDRVWYLDKNGKVATGIVKTSDNAVYFLDPNTGAIADGGSNKIVEFKGSKYCIDGTGKVVREGDGIHGLPVAVNNSVKGYDDYYYPDKIGVVKGGLKKVTGEGSVPIGSDGAIIYDPIAKIGNKYYAVVSNSKTGLSHIAVPEKDYGFKEGFTKIAGELYWVNKDGSIKTGWITAKDEETGKTVKYYQPAAVYIDSYEGRYYSGFFSEVFAIIDGKLYGFDENGAMITGWYAQKGVRIVKMEGSLYTTSDYDGNCCFYFDEKSGAAAKGWKKNMKAPALNVGVSVLTSEGQPVISNTKKTIYFMEKDTDTVPACSLAGFNISASDVTIGGKLYRFAPDGSTVSGEEGIASSDPSINKADMFIKKDGTIAKGRTKVGNDWYYFNLNTGLMEKNVLRLSGGKWYYYRSDGKMETHNTVGGYSFVFKKDGSLDKIVANGETLKNTIFTFGSSKYMIGAKGLPVTGLQKTAGISSLNLGQYFYCDSDGSVPDKKSTYTFVKSGKKIYVLYLSTAGWTTQYKASFIQITSSQEVDYSRLPAADKTAFDRYFKNIGQFGSYLFLCREDGSLITNDSVSLNGVTYVTNAYGISINDYSMFYKSGKNWYSTTDMAGVTRNEITLTDIEKYDGKTINGTMVIDQQNRLVSISRNDTGELLNGVYNVDDSLMRFKNGLPVSGSYKFLMYGAYYVEAYFDQNGGTVFWLESEMY